MYFFNAAGFVGFKMQTELSAFETKNGSIIAAYDKEILRTKQALASNPNDSGLKKAVAALETEVNPLKLKRTELQTKISELNASSGKIPAKTQEVNTEKSSNSRIRQEMEALALKLKKNRENQIKVLTQMNAIDDTLVRIRQGVRYATTKADAQLPEHQQVLTLFNPAFSKQLETIKAQAAGIKPSENIRLDAGGTLLLQSNGEWRGVCNDNFDLNDLTVACRMLGKRPGSFKSVKGTSDKFWLDEVQCSGSEASLLDCKHAGLGVDDCATDETIAIECIN